MWHEQFRLFYINQNKIICFLNRFLHSYSTVQWILRWTRLKLAWADMFHKTPGKTPCIASTVQFFSSFKKPWLKPQIFFGGTVYILSRKFLTDESCQEVSITDNGCEVQWVLYIWILVWKRSRTSLVTIFLSLSLNVIGILGVNCKVMISKWFPSTLPGKIVHSTVYHRTCWIYNLCRSIWSIKIFADQFWSILINKDLCRSRLEMWFV